MSKSEQFLEHYAACFGQPAEWRSGNPQGLRLYMEWVETVDVDLLCRAMERLSAEGEKSPKLPRLKAAYYASKNMRDGQAKAERVSCRACDGYGWNHVVLGLIAGKSYILDPEAPCRCEKTWIEVVPCICKAGEANKGAFGRRQRETAYQFQHSSPIKCRDFMAACMAAEPAVAPLEGVGDAAADWAGGGQ